MGKRNPTNRWKRLRHGDDTGHLCERCDSMLCVDRFGGGMRARCNACGAVEQLAVLGSFEKYVETKHFGVETFETTDPNELDGGNNE